MYPVIQFCVLAESVLIILRQHELEKNDRIIDSVECLEYRPFHDITGEPVEFVLKIHVGTTIEIFECIKMLEKQCVQPCQFQGRIIFMSMYNDIIWCENHHKSVCCDKANRVAEFAESFKSGRWSFLGLGAEAKWYGCLIDKPKGQWNSIADIVMQEFVESGHPMFRCSSLLLRGVLKRKGKKQFKFTPMQNPTPSVNQLSMYRAVLFWYLGRRSEGDNVSPNTNLNISQEARNPRFVG